MERKLAETEAKTKLAEARAKKKAAEAKVWQQRKAKVDSAVSIVSGGAKAFKKTVKKAQKQARKVRAKSKTRR